MANTIGEAYLQIRPSMEGIQGEIQEAMGEAGEKGSSSFGSMFAKGLGAVSAAVVTAVTVAAKEVTDLTKAAVSSFADYEQLTGGVETLFGTGGAGLEEYAQSLGVTASQAAEQYANLQRAQETVMNNADIAFRTAGLSANDYMETVTSFSASLLQSTAGDTMLAAEIADQAIIDMADNANKMGTSMESIQNAYQGFAKQNYTMLDNLKLGYGGTKEEMERLLADASALSGVEYDMSNLADVYNAIHVIQKEMGIAGTTAKEAEGTISGSLGMVSAAWTNLVTGLANPDADLGDLIGKVVDAGAVALDNLLPTIENALDGIGDAIMTIAPIITKKLPGLLSKLVPMLTQAATTLVNALVAVLPSLIQVLIQQLPVLFNTVLNAILAMLPMLIELGFSLIQAIVDGLMENLDLIIDSGLQMIMGLADGLVANLPTLIPALVDIILTIVQKLTEPDTIVQLVEVSLQLMIALAEGLIKALPELLAKAPIIIAQLITAIVAVFPDVLSTGVDLVMTFIEGIFGCFGDLISAGADIINSVKDGILGLIDAAIQWGKDLIYNFIDGIASVAGDLWDCVSGIAGGIADFLGFSEPDKGPLSNFHTYAPDMMQLFSQGIRENMGLIQGAMDMVTGTIKTDFTASVAPMTSGSVADPNEGLYGLMNQTLAVEGGDMVFPIYIGQEKIDTIIYNAQQRRNLMSGGR